VKSGTEPDGRQEMRIRSKDLPIYRLKVTLRDSSPPIWRQFLVPSHIPLKRLHDALQDVMGWTDSHFHLFEAGGVLYGTAHDGEGPRMLSENRTTLAEVLRRPKDRLTYEYDFGDSWEHDVVLEAVLPAEPGGMYPVVEAGRRACPPEDVGGIPGYMDFLEALADPKHPEHRDVTEWIDGSFDPESFSVGEANLAIHGGWVRRDPDA
jgi:hypothetical protein